jgi:hypothetical protein
MPFTIGQHREAIVGRVNESTTDRRAGNGVDYGSVNTIFSAASFLARSLAYEEVTDGEQEKNECFVWKSAVGAASPGLALYREIMCISHESHCCARRSAIHRHFDFFCWCRQSHRDHSKRQSWRSSW